MTFKSCLRAAVILAACASITPIDAAMAQTPAPALPPAPTIKKAPKPGKKCTTLTGEMVFFGQEIPRNDAIRRLDEEIVAFRAKPGNEKAKESGRNVKCELYISVLNEYLCTAAATVCK